MAIFCQFAFDCSRVFDWALNVGRWDDTILLRPSESLGRRIAAATQPTLFGGFTSARRALARKCLRMVLVRDRDCGDWNGDSGRAETNKDQESYNFPPEFHYLLI